MVITHRNYCYLHWVVEITKIENKLRGCRFIKVLYHCLWTYYLPTLLFLSYHLCEPYVPIYRVVYEQAIIGNAPKSPVKFFILAMRLTFFPPIASHRKWQASQTK